MTKIPTLHFAMQSVPDSNVHRIYLYDDIREKGDFNWQEWKYNESETSAKHFQEMLDEIPEGDKIELYINSNGGSVKEGTAIYNKLKRANNEIDGYVDGVAYSIAFTILQACDRRIMGEGTSVLLHNMWTVAAGNAEELRNEADKLDSWMEASRTLIFNRSGKISMEKLTEMMNKETVLSPDQALEYGFIDEIEGRQAQSTEGVLQAAGNFKHMREKLQSADFDETLSEFKELAGEIEKEPEKESMMDSFFNAFL